MAAVTAVDISQQVNVHSASPSAAGLSSSSSSSSQQQQQQSPPRRGILSSILCTETDSDIQEHGDSLNRLLDLVYTASTDHLKQVKTRLIEEKEIAVMDADRVASIQYEKYRNEIDRLQKELSSLEAKRHRSEDLRLMLRNKISYHLSATHRKHRSEYSLSKIFRAWYGEVQLSKQCIKMDNVARALARRSLLHRTFLSMSSSLYRRKALKEHSEAKFKFDSLTNEMVTSYEQQLQRLMDDLRDAYLSVEQEQLRRQQLEESLRGLFLKNMTAMNIEALSLFQHSHSGMSDVDVDHQYSQQHTPIRSSTTHKASPGTSIHPAATMYRGAVDATAAAGNPPAAVRRQIIGSSTPSPSSSSIHSKSSSSAVDFNRDIRRHPPSGSVAFSPHYDQHSSNKTPPSPSSLSSPSVLSPALHALQPSCYFDDNNSNSYSVSSTSGVEPAVKTSASNALSEMYRASMSSTSRLANNAASYPGKAQHVTATAPPPSYRGSRGSSSSSSIGLSSTMMHQSAVDR